MAPEAAGVDPEGVLRFLSAVQAAGIELHSLMLYRQGAVVAEGWWGPYRPDRRHMQHSLTKSFTGTAAGYALHEGRMRLDDRVLKFFPEEAPASPSENLALMTVADLLTMRSGIVKPVSGMYWRPIKTSWVAEFFKLPVERRPGTHFVYSSAPSYLLSAVVQKATGQTVRDYLEPRFFRPLAIRDIHWDLSPEGINPGGNGLSCRTADLLKLGAIHMQGGRWNGLQVLPKGWAEAATRMHVRGEETEKSPLPARHGYGYQWWGGPAGSYYAGGAFGQLSLVMPEQQTVLAVTAGTTKSVTPLVLEHLIPALGPAPRSAKDRARVELRSRLSSLQVVGPEAIAPRSSGLAKAVSGRTFRMAPNEDKVEWVAFDFAGDRCAFRMKDDRGEHRIDAGLGRWIEGRTSMTGNYLHHQYDFTDEPVVAGGTWPDERTFVMTWQYPETAFRDRVVCRFDGEGRLAVARSTNVNSGPTERPVIEGQST